MPGCGGEKPDWNMTFLKRQLEREKAYTKRRLRKCTHRNKWTKTLKIKVILHAAFS